MKRTIVAAVFALAGSIGLANASTLETDKSSSVDMTALSSVESTVNVPVKHAAVKKAVKSVKTPVARKSAAIITGYYGKTVSGPAVNYRSKYFATFTAAHDSFERAISAIKANGLVLVDASEDEETNCYTITVKGPAGMHVASADGGFVYGDSFEEALQKLQSRGIVILYAMQDDDSYTIDYLSK